MSSPAIIPGLAALADNYDVLLCDVWGVIHNGREAFPLACEALARYRAQGGEVVLISNSPRPNAQVIAQMDGLGVPREAWSLIVTSGDATRKLLAERAPGPAWKLGPERDDPLYEGLGLAFVPLEAARFIACTGPFDDERETPEAYRERFRAAIARGLPMICANPDIVVQRGEKLIYCGGALAQLYEALDGQVFMAGKPHAAIYELALLKAEERRGRPIARARVLCVGDGPRTDLRGANAQGLDVLFIANGIHGPEILAHGAIDPAMIDHVFETEGVTAAYAMADLVW
ncbi:MAG TPA: TIGR01459 family HAD-type hydrolase [Phenylobacterium sp.]|uniref:TIGR01459 family HAD-type hydrolase n=1 Tax=Phenylobacterium sp. TaxID=1871053 RepID=UPI002C1F582B|nr:TIGR01459 family HAD-type hydrolase [Phenylobacterium sp.]HSV03360.1 TIGR01459 family HAD-type hydrolase [Phenylobacterium sp.]